MERNRIRREPSSSPLFGPSSPSPSRISAPPSPSPSRTATSTSAPSSPSFGASSSSSPPSSPFFPNRTLSAIALIAEPEDEAQREGEHELLSNPSLLANTGMLLFSIPFDGRASRVQLLRSSSASNLHQFASRRLPNRGVVWSGKVVFTLTELPVHSQWLTSSGQSVDRISSRDVLLCDTDGKPKTISVPQGQIFTILYLPDYLLYEIFLHLLPPEHRWGSLFQPTASTSEGPAPLADLDASCLRDVHSGRLVCRVFNVTWKKLLEFDEKSGPKRKAIYEKEEEEDLSSQEEDEETEDLSEKTSEKVDKGKDVEKDEKLCSSHEKQSSAESGESESTADDNSRDLKPKARESHPDAPVAPPAPPAPDEASVAERRKSSYHTFFDSFSKLPTARQVRRAKEKDVIQPLTESGELARRQLIAASNANNEG